jgi:uncharacterized peroxidase-related enzyme
LLGSEALPRALVLDHESADLDARDRAMVDHAVKLTRAPHSVREADIDRLREVGFDDTAILDLCQVVSYYGYVNRMAEGLGVELEDTWLPEELTMTREDFERRVAARRQGP